MQKSFHHILAALLIAALVWASLPVRPAYAAGYVVDSLADNTAAGDGFCTLREAIQSANNAGNGDCGPNSAADDTITFSVSGTITLVSFLGIVTGQGALTIDGGGNITISGNNSVQVFYVNSGAALTLQNLTIANGFSSSGGGISNDSGGTVTVINSAFSGNSAYYGGGIRNFGALTVTDSTFSGNSATYYGGGIRNFGTLTVTNSAFSSNSATYNGGGIDNFGMLMVTNSAFSGNSADYGGGIYSSSTGSTVTVANSTFSGNLAPYGGGIYNGTGSTVTVTNSTFSGHFSIYGYGGGIYNGSTLTVTNSTLSGNSAGYDGGGIYNGSALTLNNAIIANSAYGSDCVNYPGAASSGYNNLIESSANACGLTDGVNGNIIGQDPNLGALTGSPAYFPLNPGSLAIDAGNNAICAAPPVSSQSQNGVLRPQDGDGNSIAICDIGSYELDLTAPTVTVNQSTGQSDPTNASPILFTAVFSEPINAATFTAADVDLSASAAPGALAAAVTEIAPNDGTTFEISVSGMTGSGTVVASIPANAVQDLSGNNNTASSSADNTVTYDVNSPLVAATSLTVSYTGSGPGNFTVAFSKAVQDPPGNSGADDVTNPANYLLINKGANGLADTASCAGGLAGDDAALIVNSVGYNAAAFTSTVTLASAPGAGSYRLFVCGTTSIVDLANNPLNGGTSDYTFDFVVTAAGSSSSASSAGVSTLPATGFAQGRITSLPQQPVEKAYASYNDLILEIPSLNVKAPIVGALKSGGSWDVTWLGNSVGWLEGSAFPTWAGNTVLTGHVWNADNTPGIFAEIKNLKYGDRFYIHAFGKTYVYEVRENRLLSGLSGAASVFRHEEYDWVTLLTCEGYSERTDTYLFRRMARAALVEIK
ncbi:MAG: sortase [Chloroflexi bacterium]|nr:sortase [Chloroflexota bacterium]